MNSASVSYDSESSQRNLASKLDSLRMATGQPKEVVKEGLVVATKLQYELLKDLRLCPQNDLSLAQSLQNLYIRCTEITLELRKMLEFPVGNLWPKEDLQPFVDEILASVEALCPQRACFVGFVLSEDTNWFGDITWPNTDPAAKDWVSVLVASAGIQVLCNDVTTWLNPIPLGDPEWHRLTVMRLMPLLAPNRVQPESNALALVAHLMYQ